jgi:death-on-curing protein
MTFGGEDLYPEPADKAAALMHSLVMNHPFVDGNKRVGAHCANATASRRPPACQGNSLKGM